MVIITGNRVKWTDFKFQNRMMYIKAILPKSSSRAPSEKEWAALTYRMGQVLQCILKDPRSLMKTLCRMWGNKGILEVLCDHEHTRLGGGGMDRLMGKVSHKVAWDET